MSVFKIKIKTKNGNDIKNKQTFTVFFVYKITTSLLTGKTEARYTYKIFYNKGVYDKKTVFTLTNETKEFSKNLVLVKIVINMLHLINSIAKKENILPDTILFISPLLKANNTLTMIDSFITVGKDTVFNSTHEVKEFYKGHTKKHGINDDCLDLLIQKSKNLSQTYVKWINPSEDKEKYAKSIGICNQLTERFNRLQVTS